MRTFRRPFVLFLMMLCTAPLLMAPSGKIQGCAGYYAYTDCQSGQTQECYTGPATTKGKGVCKAGIQTCSNEGLWGSCEGEVTPNPANPGECKDECVPTCPQGQSCKAGKCESETTGPKPLFKGTFVGASGHSTVGETEISQDGTKEIVTLKADFKTDSGPELRVYLVADEKGVATNDNFIDIGKLKSTSGEQMYELPVGKSTKDYKSVVIWCKPFGVNFGYATLVAP